MTKRKASVALENGNESNQSSSTQDNNSNSTSATNTTTGTNNRGSHNGTSNANNVTERQQIGGDNEGGQQKNKKERADNWSTAEIQVLHRGIETRRDIFYGPPNQATKKNRELAWEAITKEVNSVSTTPRNLSQVMKKFKNEKCRAKRKFIDTDKDGHNSINNNISVITNNTTNNSNNNLSAQNHPNNTNNQPQQQQQQQQQQPLHMTANETMSSQPSSINVVKLAPQNVAKTMIDLPGHVQQIQMPNDDMVLIVPPDMDGLISGMNIVSDALNNQQHNHHGQHTIQAINTGQGLVNGTMSNGMMTRTIPAGSMCSLVYSTGSEICGTDQHLTNSITGPNSLATNHINVNSQGLMHHRTTVEQSQGQQQQHQHPQHHHQLHQHQQSQQQPHQHHQQQQQQQQPQQQQQQQQTHQSHQSAQHHQHPHLQQNHMTNTATAIASTGGVAVESQLKNLLFNLLLKDGQNSVTVVNPNQDYNKQRNDMLAIIASSLNKIEGHLSKISKVATTLYTQNINGSSNDNVGISNSSSLNNQSISLNINNNDGNDSSLNITGTGSASTISNQGGNET